eukprot:gnl/TRDRNA2_/TRDRNA2_122337_c1_seq2.p1 gnl/TRDRNA2_/TRDRNA2_122337_c1~~gnl/TRDRNA2_/TRDRNA2_122337_c1_seq2.p1  ORF type:complete len:119 (+),score=11.02 gnl/TRDRNA2_/TRDRNA2_122337_c1_seq2:130-486(+)
MPNGECEAIEPENLKTPGGIWRTNVYDFPPTGTQVLFALLSRINHSCVPNVQKQRSRRTDEFVVTAVRNIREGEELCISYGVPEGSVNERRAWLDMKYKFVCHCEACDREIAGSTPLA